MKVNCQTRDLHSDHCHSKGQDPTYRIEWGIHHDFLVEKWLKKAREAVEGCGNAVGVDVINGYSRTDRLSNSVAFSSIFYNR